LLVGTLLAIGNRADAAMLSAKNTSKHTRLLEQQGS